MSAVSLRGVTFTYPDATDPALEGVSLEIPVGVFTLVVGPTGSGKSSLLDGIAYALYGMTPRLRRGQKRLICSRSSGLHVRLRFSVDERVYEVTRALPRSGAGESVLTEDASGQRWMGAEAVTGRITELLGLDLDGFCSSVLLAQNRFSRFLDATPTERANILKGVFRLERIDELRQAAKARCGRLEVEIATVEGEMRSIPADAAERHAAALERAESCCKRARQLDAARPREKGLEDEARAAGVCLESARAELEALEEISARVPAEEGLLALAREEAGVEERARAAEDRLLARKRSLEEATEAYTALETEVGREPALVEARAAAAAATEADSELGALQERIAREEATVRSLSEGCDAVRADQVAAEADLQRARDDLERARRAHAAHAVRGGLQRGEPCPVCLQPVDEVPRVAPPAAVTQVEERVAAAEERLRRARAGVESAALELASAQSALRHCSEEAERIRERRGGMLRRVEELVGQHDDPGAEIAARLHRLDAGRRMAEQARVDSERAGVEVEGCFEARGRFVTRRQDFAAKLIALAGRLDLPSPAVDDPADKLVEHAAALRSALRERASVTNEHLAAAETSLAELSRALKELRAGLQLEPGSTIAGALAEASAEARMNEEGASALAGQLARAAELEDRREHLVARRRVFERLADDFRDANFVHYLLEDRRRLLSELGSERLREISRRYRFDDGAAFDVVDELDGDKVRETATLSGGETFLASLALALGLAEAVSRSGGRLQCFFLDEGFGSLDAESLDLALDGIERIVSEDRLIGLVSHVAAMAERVDDRIELGGDADGMSVLVSGAEAS